MEIESLKILAAKRKLPLECMEEIVKQSCCYIPFVKDPTFKDPILGSKYSDSEYSWIKAVYSTEEKLKSSKSDDIKRENIFVRKYPLNPCKQQSMIYIYEITENYLFVTNDIEEVKSYLKLSCEIDFAKNQGLHSCILDDCKGWKLQTDSDYITDYRTEDILEARRWKADNTEPHDFDYDFDESYLSDDGTDNYINKKVEEDKEEIQDQFNNRTTSDVSHTYTIDICKLWDISMVKPKIG